MFLVLLIAEIQVFANKKLRFDFIWLFGKFED